MRGTSKKERKRNVAALTPKFKIKDSFERGEFVRVMYANFSQVGIPADHKNAMSGERKSVCKRQN